MKKQKNNFNSRRGGLWFGEIFWAGFAQKFPVVAMPRTNPWNKLPWGSTSTFFSD